MMLLFVRVWVVFQFFMRYGPSFDLDIIPGLRKDHNTAEYVQGVIKQVKGQLTIRMFSVSHRLFMLVDSSFTIEESSSSQSKPKFASS